MNNGISTSCAIWKCKASLTNSKKIAEVSVQARTEQIHGVVGKKIAEVLHVLEGLRHELQQVLGTPELPHAIFKDHLVIAVGI